MDGRRGARKFRKIDLDTYGYDVLIPSSIFCDRRLSVLEVIVEFLKESHHLGFSEIAHLMNRDSRNIWTVYRRANAKRSGQPLPKGAQDGIFIPLSIFRDRKLSILEVLVRYLRAYTSLSNHQIGRLLSRDDKTIWTVYDRSKRKLRHG